MLDQAFSDLVAEAVDDGPLLVWADLLEEQGDCEKALGIRKSVWLDRIIAEPENDSYRDSYATVLTTAGEDGKLRAEFIRLQLADARFFNAVGVQADDLDAGRRLDRKLVLLGTLAKKGFAVGKGFLESSLLELDV